MTAYFRFSLVSMIAVSVVADSMLLPFYPQFFASAFAVNDPRHIGFYLAATSFVVMLAFPLWAAVAKSVPVVRLLVYTQFAAGVLSILCYGAGGLLDFWLVSLLMLVFKGSYLLIYPHIMRFEQKDRHGSTIGLLSVIVHIGAIIGAGAGGFVLQLFDPRQVFLLMSVGDFLQMALCISLLGRHAPGTQETHEERQSRQAPAGINFQNPVYRLGLVMFLFYFSIWLVRPFFSRYWESISVWNGEIVSGLVFAIPGGMALLALRLGNGGKGKQGIASALVLGVAGFLLQASGQEWVVLLGRCLYGWSLFHATVGLDVLLFDVSTPQSYATDFSKIYFCQSLGALIASYGAGALVAFSGLQMPLIAGASGLALTVFLHALLFKTELKPAEAIAETP